MTSQIMSQNQWGKVLLKPLGEGLQQLIIEHQHSHARVSLYGGQVLAWQPVNEEEVFWLSKDACYQQGKAIRGGIPLCCPWFGDYKGGGNHGFARQVNWQYQIVDITEGEVIIQLTWQGENQHKLWPSKAKFTQTLTFGEAFKQTLNIENLSKSSIKFTEALHSYFNISHPATVQVPRLTDVKFDCKLTGGKGIKDKRVNVVGPVDRIYYSTQPIEIVDTGLARTIVVTSNNANNWVLWNPGREIADTIIDIHYQGENEYVCLEAANTDWQIIAAESSACFGQTICIVRH